MFSRKTKSPSLRNGAFLFPLRYHGTQSGGFQALLTFTFDFRYLSNIGTDFEDCPVTGTGMLSAIFLLTQMIDFDILPSLLSHQQMKNLPSSSGGFVKTILRKDLNHGKIIKEEM
jgi:hypothetical protein